MLYQRESRASQRLSPCLHDTIENRHLKIDLLRLLRTRFQWCDARSHTSSQNLALAIGHRNISDPLVGREDPVTEPLVVHYPQRCATIPCSASIKQCLSGAVEGLRRLWSSQNTRGSLQADTTARGVIHAGMMIRESHCAPFNDYLGETSTKFRPRSIVEEIGSVLLLCRSLLQLLFFEHSVQYLPHITKW